MKLYCSIANSTTKSYLAYFMYYFRVKSCDNKSSYEMLFKDSKRSTFLKGLYKIYIKNEYN